MCLSVFRSPYDIDVSVSVQKATARLEEATGVPCERVETVLVHVVDGAELEKHEVHE